MTFFGLKLMYKKQIVSCREDIKNESNNNMWKFKISKRNDDSSRKLALEGNCVLTPVYPISENLEKTEKQLGKLKEANFKRIELSNSIRVKNNLSEQDTDKFLSLTRTKLENKNYKVYFSHARFTYKNANMMVQPNELIIAIKEE